MRAAFLLAVLLPSALASAAQPMQPQGAHDLTVGPGGGLTPTTSPTGGFPAAVPLELPSSRDGLPVPVQVRYTASPRTGAAGMSWDVPLSYVRVSDSTMRRKPSVETGPTDGNTPLSAPRRVFVALDGNATLMVPGDQTGKYVPFVADQYMELREVAGGWRLETLGGTRYTFAPVSSLGSGAYADPDLWLLTEIGHVASPDRVTVEYDIQPVACQWNDASVGAEVNIARVRHTFDETGVPLYEINLVHRGFVHPEVVEPTCSRPTDGTVSEILSVAMDEGYAIARRRILQRVEVHARHNVLGSDLLRRVRSYDFTYDADPETKGPRLVEVTMQGEAGVAPTEPQVVAQYEYGQPGQRGAARPIPRLFSSPGGDMTGAYADALSSSEVETEEFVFEFVPDAPVGLSADPVTFTAAQETLTTRQVIRDFTGDGLPDLVFKAGDVWTMYVNRTTDTGTRFDVGPPVTWTEPSEIFEQTTFRFTGASLEYKSARSVPVTTETWVQFLDWNGDGRLDVVDARHGRNRDHWAVWINEGVDGTTLRWRRENVHVDALRPRFDGDEQLRELQAQVTAATRATIAEISPFDVLLDDAIPPWGEDHPPYYFDLGASGRFPLERSRSWPRAYGNSCELHLEGGGDLPCAGVPMVQGATDTRVEWRLTELNGDGYPDFVASVQPVVQCQFEYPEVIPSEVVPGSDGIYAGGTRWHHFQALDHGYCPESGVLLEEIEPRPTLERSEFLNIGGSLFPPGYGDIDGDVFRLKRIGPGDAISVWSNGDDGLQQYGTSENITSFDPSPTTEVRGFADLVGDGVPRSVINAARFDTDRWDVCTDDAPPDTPYVSEQIEGYADINGDGLIDQVLRVGNHMAVAYGGGGLGRAPAVPVGIALSESSGTCGGDAVATKGLLDLDGDGKAEIVEVVDGQLQARYLEGPDGRPAVAAGRLVGVSDGHGAWTRIAYRNNKTDWRTEHAVPFPEIVVSEFRVDVDEAADGPGIIPTRYAYGGARMKYDPLLARWSFPGYERTVALTGNPLQHGPESPFTEGIAVITDRAPVAEAGSGYEAFVLGGRTIRTTRLEATFGVDPRELLDVDVDTDTRVRGGGEVEYDTVELPTSTASAPGQECFDADGASGAYPLPDYDLCQRGGLVYTSGTSTWEGLAAPTSSTSNVWSASYAQSSDPFGRPTYVVNLGDVRRFDDDTCTTIHYASPAQPSLGLVSAVADVSVTDCGWGNPDHSGTVPQPGPHTIIAGARFVYDGLGEGWVGHGRRTSTIVERYSDTGLPMGEIVAGVVSYDEKGLVDRVVRTRELDAATRTLTYEYDRWGATVVRSTAAASDLGTVLVRESRIPVWPSERAEVTTPTGEVYRSYRDSLGRPVQDTVQAGGGTEYVVTRSAYDDTPLDRAVTTTVFYGSTPAATPTSGATRWARATTHVDAMGRAMFTQQELGSDYGGSTLIKRWSLHDDWGRVYYAAAPFVWSSVEFDPDAMTTLPYGTTFEFDRGSRLVKQIDGPGLQQGIVATDLNQDIYPTLIDHRWIDGRYVQRVMGPSELSATTPSFGVCDETQTTASGRSISSARYSAAGVRLDLVERDIDRLGRLVRTRRHQNAASGAGVVEWQQRHDSLGQVLLQSEPGTSDVTTVYDDWGAPILTEWMDGTTRRRSHFDYDGFGRITERRLAKLAQGATAEQVESTDFYYYDEHSGDDDQAAGASLLGRLSWSETMGVAATFLTYDPLGRQTRSTTVHADEGVPYTTRTALTATGTVDGIGLDHPDGSDTLTYTYDSAGRMRLVALQGNSGPTYLLGGSVVDPLGRYKTLHLGNGAREDYSFHPTGRQELSTWEVRTAADLRRVTYDELDPELRVKRVTDFLQPNGASPTATQTTNTYDALDRLTASVSKRGSTTTASYGYSYDGLGNLRSATVGSTTLDLVPSATDLDRLHESRTVGGFLPPRWRYAYDGAGNVVSQALVSGATTEQPRSFQYDSSSRITSMQRGSSFAAFTYGPDGGVAKEEVVINGALNRRVRHYGPLMEQRQRPGGGKAVERYVPGPMGVFVSIRGTGSGRTFVYNHGDGRANRFFTGTTGQVVQTAEYQPYGKVQSQTGQPASQDYSDDLFNGGDLYGEFGVVILGARIYDPVLGRFLQRDPIAFVPRSTAGNPYSFSWGDPINHRDPSGLTPDPMPHLAIYGSTIQFSSDGLAFVAFVVTTALSSDFTEAGAKPPSGVVVLDVRGVGLARSAEGAFAAAKAAITRGGCGMLCAAEDVLSDPSYWKGLELAGREMVNGGLACLEAGIERCSAEMVLGLPDAVRGWWALATDTEATLREQGEGDLRAGIYKFAILTGIGAATGRFLPNQMHHFATNKNRFWTPRMQNIAGRYGLDLDGAWNKELLQHIGRHPNAYHEFVLDAMEYAAREAGEDVAKFLAAYERLVKEVVRNNPSLLRADGWRSKGSP